MLRYVIQRLLQGIIVLFLVSIGTFGILQLAPGDPIDILIGSSGQAQVTQEQVDRIQARWGLDKPWYQQYFTWISNFLQGDFGTSIVRTGVPASEMVLDAAWPTVKINALAILVALIIALPAGLIAGVKHYSIFDSITMIGASGGISLPNFWVALVLIIIFAGQLRWLPATGLGSWQAYILPVLVLAINETAIQARLMRSTTLEVLGQDYVTTARAKGLAEHTVVMRHIVRNALLPIITVLGFRMAFLFSGTIIVETIFAIPGIGRLFYNSVIRLDYQVVQAIVVLFTLLVIFMNLITDLAYAVIDPRIRIRD